MSFGVFTLFSLLAVSTPAEDVCGALSGSEALLEATEGRVLVIGEIHGTEQVPQFIQSLACLSLARGESVVIGLEQPADEQVRLNAYLQSDGDADARSALIEASPFWTSSSLDGRSSEAIFGIVEYAREQAGEGEPLAVAALDFSPEHDSDLDADPARRDRAMSRRALVLADDFDRVIALAGNIHARRTAATFGDRQTETIGSVSPPERFAFINTVYGVGSVWNCRISDGGAPSCRVYGRSNSPFSGDPRLIGASEIEEMSGRSFYADPYDYLVFLGEVRASPPAVRAAREQSVARQD